MGPLADISIYARPDEAFCDQTLSGTDSRVGTVVKLVKNTMAKKCRNVWAWRGSVRDWSMCIREKIARWVAFVGGSIKTLMVLIVRRQTSAAR